METMYTRIKDLREQKNMSQDELARKAGYTSRSSIAKIESGQVDISQSKLIAIADALDTTPSFLLGWKPLDYTKKNTPQRLEDPRLREICSAWDEMTEKEREKMMNVLRATFEEYFQ